MIFERHANLKHKFENRHFWSRGYYVNTAGIQEKAIVSESQRLKSAGRTMPVKALSYTMDASQQH